MPVETPQRESATAFRVLAAISMNGDEPEYVLILMRGNQPIEAVNVLTDLSPQRASEAVACALRQMLEVRIQEQSG